MCGIFYEKNKVTGAFNMCIKVQFARDTQRSPACISRNSLLAASEMQLFISLSLKYIFVLQFHTQTQFSLSDILKITPVSKLCHSFTPLEGSKPSYAPYWKLRILHEIVHLAKNRQMTQSGRKHYKLQF